MRLARFEVSGSPRAGVLDAGGDVLALPRGDDGGTDLVTLLGEVGEEKILEIALRWGERLDRAAVRLLAPVPWPLKIVAVGRNYADHARELGNEVPDEPILFLKGSNCIVGPGEDVVIPEGVGGVEHEVELAVVIGQRVRKASRGEACASIAGYTVIVDVTARALQRELGKAGKPWYAAKGLDTFAPLGPCLRTTAGLEHPLDLATRLSVNGDTRQEDRTSSMVFPVDELLSRISQRITLEPGDIVATGTPAGVGPLVPGDRMTAEIEEVGILECTIIAEERNREVAR